MTKLHRRLIAQLCEQVLQRKFCLESLWQEGNTDKISSTKKMHFDTTIITRVMDILGHIYQDHGKETKYYLTLTTLDLIWEAGAEVLEDFTP